MYVKLVLYVIMIPLSIFALDSVNINNIFKKNKVFQARLLYFMLSLALAYLVVNMLYDFSINCKIL